MKEWIKISKKEKKKKLKTNEKRKTNEGKKGIIKA